MNTKHKTLTKGRLFIFEGPDGIGKSTLREATIKYLIGNHIPAIGMNFPGSIKGTLGELVYRIHHNPKKFVDGALNPLSLQTLHVAAHIEAIEGPIREKINSGTHVLLDRYWWSTWVYGIVSGIPEVHMNALVKLEQVIWGNLRPTVAFLIKRDEPFKAEQDSETFKELTAAYEDISSIANFPVERIENDASLNKALQKILDKINV